MNSGIQDLKKESLMHPRKLLRLPLFKALVKVTIIVSNIKTNILAIKRKRKRNKKKYLIFVSKDNVQVHYAYYANTG